MTQIKLLRVIDNGMGMDFNELYNSMKLGCKTERVTSI